MAGLFKGNPGPLLRAQVDDVLPEHIKTNYPKYVEFLRHCVDYLEYENKSGFYLNRVHTQRDIDLVNEEFLQELQQEVGNAIPQTYAANPRLFYKRLGEIYRSRGTPDSIVAFFKLLYNDNVQLYFPKDDIFAPSDGRWFDNQADVQANPENYSSAHTFTISGTPTDIGGLTLDDGGFPLKYDKPSVFVNGVLVNNWTPFTTIDTVGEKLLYWLRFDAPLNDGDVLQVYRSGLFSTNDGFLDDGKKLQDSFFYQKFSYVLQTGTDVDLWKNAFTRLIHPAGFIYFGEILILIEVFAGAPSQQPGWQVGGEPVIINVGTTYAGTTVISVMQDIPVAPGKTFTEKYPIYTIEFGAQTQDNPLAPYLYFEQIKFQFNGTTIGQLGEYTIEQAINNEIPFTMDAQIELSA